MINEINIENFKSLANNKFELKNLTLLTGASSSGKSTLIQAILLIKGSFEKNKDIFYIIKSKLLKLNDKDVLEIILREILIENNYITLGNVGDILYEKAKEDNIKIELKLNTGMTLLNCEIEDKESKTLKNKLLCDGKILELLEEENLTYISANRIVPESFYKYSKENVEKGQLGKNGEYAIHYLAENKNKKISIHALKHENSSGLDRKSVV